MAVTIKELSARCGLSVSTVSKALNDYPDVSEETRKQVRAVADEMGYRANAIARSLKIVLLPGLLHLQGLFQIRPLHRQRWWSYFRFPSRRSRSADNLLLSIPLRSQFP